MTVSLGQFLQLAMAHPALLVIFLLVMGSVIINGATDASNAIATSISTRSMRPEIAIMVAAAGNFLGLVLVTLVSTAVAKTIFHIVNFNGDTHHALLALASAMVAIIVWGALAWRFGIPSSQSHSLIAGLTGAAIGLHGGLDGVNMGEWVKVIYGLFLSAFLGFFLGGFCSKLVGFLFRKVDRRKTHSAFGWATNTMAFGLAFMHGAQDGQKFLSIAFLGITLTMGLESTDGLSLPLWLMTCCSLVMALGTAVGGKRIIKSVAMDMVKLERYQGFSASLASVICLIIATFGGLPVSTTHTSTTAIMGVGAERRLSAVRWGVAKEMALTWVLTFPGCGLIGYVLSKVFVHLF